MADAARTIVFDGHCVLCNGWVRFLLRHDHAMRYSFASMQGVTGAALLERHGLDPSDPSSFLLVEAGSAYTNTDAIVRVVAGLGGPWTAVRALRMLPARWRDAVYRAVARNRYRWFGRREQCALPDPAQRARFLD